MLNDTYIAYKRAFNAIYQIENDHAERTYRKLFKGHLYFTTYEDLGKGYRGYLYVLDTANNTLIKDLYLKHSYLYSAGGMFVIDTVTDKIFTIGKPEWYEEKNAGILAASMYKVDGNHFTFLKNVYEFGVEGLDTATVVTYFSKSLANNARNGKRLPANWWKVK